LEKITIPDKIFHYGAGKIAFLLGVRYFGSFIGVNLGIIALNTLWEVGGERLKRGKFCWLDWIAVELGAISSMFEWIRDPFWSPIGFAMDFVAYLILAWAWGIFPFRSKDA